LTTTTGKANKTKKKNKRCRPAVVRPPRRLRQAFSRDRGVLVPVVVVVAIVNRRVHTIQYCIVV